MTVTRTTAREYDLVPGKAVTRLTPCKRCKALVVEASGYFMAKKGKGSRTFICQECADHWADEVENYNAHYVAEDYSLFGGF